MMSGNVTGTSSDDCRRLACGVTFCGDPHQARGAGFQRSRWATFVLHCRMPLRGTTDEVWLRGKSGKYKCMMGWQPKEQPSVEHWLIRCDCVALDDCDGQACVVG